MDRYDTKPWRDPARYPESTGFPARLYSEETAARRRAARQRSAGTASLLFGTIIAVAILGLAAILSKVL